MKKLLNFAYKYISLVIIVFCSTVYGMNIESQNSSQKTINPHSATVMPNLSNNLKAILDRKKATEIEDLFKSAACEIYWIKVRFSSHDEEILEDALWRIRRESPVGLSGGEPFIRFLNECLTSNVTTPIISKENAKLLIAECCKSEDECGTLEEKERFIIKCCDIVAGLRYYLKSH